MQRTRFVAVAMTVMLGLGMALAACSSSSDNSSSGTTTTTKESGGVALSSTTQATGAAGDTVEVVVSDTSGLNGPMTMVATPSTMPAGEITFHLVNKGTIEHEMVVIKLDSGQSADGLTVTDDTVSEDTSVGEVSETEAGQEGSVTLNLEPGNYALVCNIAKHYSMGMYTSFTVT